MTPAVRAVVLGGRRELVTNGRFDLDPINGSQNTVQNGWQWSRAGGAVTPTWANGQVSFEPDNTNEVRIDTSFPTIPGRGYTLTFDMLATGAVVSVGTSQGNASLASGSSGTGAGRAFAFTAATDTTWLRIRRTLTGAVTIDNVSVR